MRICRRFHELQDHLPPNLKTGFVPTMGALHQGHLSLIRRAASECDFVIASIFINPLQFNNQGDLNAYPRQESQDIALLESVGCDLLFLPENSGEVFEQGKKTSDWDFEGLDSLMEGSSRPGHFKGVAEVVARFFEIIKPQQAYFGEKDFQQLQIIRKMTRVKGFPIKIIPCPILRESNGLAMSSRNQRLSDGGKKNAAILFQILKRVAEQPEGTSMKASRKMALEMLKEVPDIELDYLILAEEQQLQEREIIKKGEEKLRLFIAATIEGVRLIDNLPIE